MQNIITDYIHGALEGAIYRKLEDGSVCGRVSKCIGVITFAKDLESCHKELQAALEGWILFSLHLGHTIPVINGINLNREPNYEGE